MKFLTLLFDLILWPFQGIRMAWIIFFAAEINHFHGVPDTATTSMIAIAIFFVVINIHEKLPKVPT